MNIYFACSITGGREFESIYQTITRVAGGRSPSGANRASGRAGVVSVEAVIDPREVYTRDTTWIQESDVLIAEVSVPSHGVGYEIGYALGLGKPVLALYQEGRKVSKMISGNPDPGLAVRCYQSPENAVEIIRAFLSTQFIREKSH